MKTTSHVEATARKDGVGRRIGRLAFPPELERSFRIAENAVQARSDVVTITAAVVALNAFLLTDKDLIPDVFDLAVVLRIGIMTPLFVLYLPLRSWAIRRDPASALHALYASALYLLSFAFLLVLHARTESRTAADYFIGCHVVIVYFNCLGYGGFKIHFWTTCLACLLFAFGIMQVTVTQPAVKLDATLSLVVTAVLTLLGVYRVEFNRRARFLAHARAQSLLAEQTALAARLNRANAELRTHALTDPLTGLANRRRLDEVRRRLEARSIPASRIGVVMIDVDHFKLFNDRHGHTAGDACLVAVARALRGAVRPRDLVVRAGGEEFLVLLIGLSAEAAAEAAERLHRAVAGLAIPHGARPDGLDRVSVSVGAAIGPAQPGTSLAQRIAAADAALYRAKLAGRDRVAVADPVRERMPSAA
ncbi:GGDEF domain-containing protein [Methylobacterium planeticum]|nr:GGDEF domain-containing protein [Methylobacterium planeticum]